ncbi:hypothetical protein [Sulfitobacter sp. MF3-043]|uniref:hypothetical protein n=1 Tax=Sulfitobacter sediminivivens TaxID=3252902 RepID=UPI003EBB0BCC
METSIVFADISRTIEPLTVNSTPHPSCQPNQLPFFALLGGMEFSAHAASFALRELAERNYNDWIGLFASVSRGRNEGLLLGLRPQFSNGFKLNDGFWHPYDTRSTFDASSRLKE